MTAKEYIEKYIYAGMRSKARVVVINTNQFNQVIIWPEDKDIPGPDDKHLQTFIEIVDDGL